MTRLSPKAITEASMEELPKGNLDTRFSNRIAFGLGVKFSESIYIPQIEKLQGEIVTHKQQIDLLLLEIGQLKELGYTTLNDYREESKMRIDAEKELAQLTAKHDRLVKVAEGIAAIAHHGGLLGFITETKAMTEIRKITLPYWDKDEADRLQQEAIKKLTEEGNV